MREVEAACSNHVTPILTDKAFANFAIALFSFLRTVLRTTFILIIINSYGG